MGKSILFVNSCVRGKEVSRTYELALFFINKFIENNKEYTFKELNISELGLKYFDKEMIEERDNAVNEGNDSKIIALAKDFKEHDMIVVAAPYWDMMFPSVLKIYYEHIAASGVTFKYENDGTPKGLCNADKAVYVTTAGGFIGTNNYGFDYTKGLFEFFGIKETFILKAEGLDIWGNDSEFIIKEAKKEAEILAEKI